jgi:hypothetical protein
MEMPNLLFSFNFQKPPFEVTSSTNILWPLNLDRTLDFDSRKILASTKIEDSGLATQRLLANFVRAHDDLDVSMSSVEHPKCHSNVHDSETSLSEAETGDAIKVRKERKANESLSDISMSDSDANDVTKKSTFKNPFWYESKSTFCLIEIQFLLSLKAYVSVFNCRLIHSEHLLLLLFSILASTLNKINCLFCMNSECFKL